MKNRSATRFAIHCILFGSVSLCTLSNLDGDESVLIPSGDFPAIFAPTSEPESPENLPAVAEPEAITPYVAQRFQEANNQLTINPSVPVAEDASDGEIVRERYDDGSVRVERSVMQDEHGNFVNNGTFRMYNPAGSPIAEGHFQMGNRHGEWRRVYATADASLLSAYPYNEFEAPFVSKATFAHGQLHGSWIISDADGKIVSEIPFRNGLRHGQAVWHHPGGERMYIANYRDGMLEGVMAEYDDAGAELTSYTFQDGRRVEREIERYKSQQPKADIRYLSAQQTLKQRDDWWNAKPAVYETSGKRLKHGGFVEYHPNGQKKSTGTYAEGRLTGEFSSWYENGQRETQGFYQDGAPSGAWAWWHANGMRRAEGSYANGAPEGQWTSWTPDGKVAKRQNYSEANQSDIARNRTPAPTPKRPSSASNQRRVQR
ncbi:toxin-antitoxin system YwqK family antitoxin [Rosistilla oblonga]|uniref:toxin-antitoxin system YwqK family antitoxin n=1 Tax=Rosistilla oblonga TaxID=2527990 RepID=UPI003A98410F